MKGKAAQTSHEAELLENPSTRKIADGRKKVRASNRGVTYNYNRTKGHPGGGSRPIRTRLPGTECGHKRAMRTGGSRTSEGKRSRPYGMVGDATVMIANGIPARKWEQKDASTIGTEDERLRGSHAEGTTQSATLQAAKREWDFRHKTRDGPYAGEKRKHRASIVWKRRMAGRYTPRRSAGAPSVTGRISDAYQGKSH